MRRVRVLLNGRPLSQQRGLQRQDGTQGHIQVNLPAHDVELSLIAENKHGASLPASISLRWQGDSGGFKIRPKLYILSIGVSNYQDKSLKLNYAAKDAKDFADAMRQQNHGLYRDVEVKLLQNPDRDQLLDGLDWLERQATSKDVAMLFLAGHGVNDKKGDYYFLPVNANLDKLRRTAISYFDIKSTVSNLSSKTLVFIDSCHSGNVMGKFIRRGVPDITAVINDLTSAENGVVVFASSTGKQSSYEHVRWKNGAFTEALVEGINGKADYTQDGKITINQLDLYLSERVKTLTENRQTPVTTKPHTIADYPIIWLR